MKKSKVIGTVVALSGAHAGGFVIHLYRYPNSRTLPAMKILIQNGSPYRSRLAALEDLGAYQRGELILGRSRFKVEEPAPEPTLVRMPKKIKAKRISPAERMVMQLAALDLDFDPPAPKAALPAIVKMPAPTPKAALTSKARIRTEQRAATKKLCKGVKVKKYAAAERQGDSRPRRMIRANMAEGLYC